MQGPENPIDPDEILFTSEPEIVYETLPPEPQVPANYLCPETHPDEGVLIVLDPEKNIFVTAGVPVESNKGVNFQVIAIPNNPHVFIVHEMKFIQQNDNSTTILQNVPILMGHAMRSRREDGSEIWRFLDGSPVVETVEALDKYCEKNGLPKIEVIVACNAKHPEDESGVGLADFDYQRRIVQVIREEPNLPANQGRLFENGVTKLQIEADSFTNLDRLATEHEIEILEEDT